MDNIQMLEALENIDIMSTSRGLLVDNKTSIKDNLDYLRTEFSLERVDQLKYIREKNKSLAQDGYVNIQKIIRINGLLNMLKVFLDMDILEKLKKTHRGITGELTIGLDLLDYDHINLKALIYSNLEANISDEEIGRFKNDYMDLVIKRMHRAVVRDDSSIAYIEMSLPTSNGLKYLYGNLKQDFTENMETLVFNLVKYLDKLLEIRITEYEFENDFLIFLSVYDLAYRFLMGETGLEEDQLLQEYIDGIRRVSMNYLKDSRQGVTLEKDVDNFIAYLDSIYDNDYQELLIRSNYPSVILKFNEEKDSLYGFEIVEFYL